MEPALTWIGQFGVRWRPGGQAMWPARQVERSPLTQPSPPHVDAWQLRLRLNRLKPWQTGHGVGPAGRPLGPVGLGSGPLGPHVKYTPIVMMILTISQLHFVILCNAPIWYLSS
jgi:hypothetical protein